MARYIGPKLKLSRREGTDLQSLTMLRQKKQVVYLVSMAIAKIKPLNTLYNFVRSKK